MIMRHEPSLASSYQPALMLLFGAGNSAQKRRLLDRDALIIGKSRGCDLVLEAPDVSALHCVVTRQPAGFAVRDCNSRAGTKVNGHRITEARLHDGDLLQVGPFSFQVSIPTLGGQSILEQRCSHVEQKRHRLLQLALRQRRRIHQQAEHIRALLREAGLHSHNGVAEQASLLRDRMRSYEERLQKLEQAERQLARDQEVMLREMSDVQTQQHEAEARMAHERRDLETVIGRARGSWEQELAQKRGALDLELQSRRQELEQAFQARAAELEQELAARLAAAPPAEAAANDMEQTLIVPMVALTTVVAPPQDLPNSNETPVLEKRKLELQQWAEQLSQIEEQLRQEQQRLGHKEQQILREYQIMHVQHEELKLSRAEWERQHAEATLALERQRKAVAQAELGVREQRATVMAMMADLKQMQEALRSKQSEEMAALRRENAELSQLVEELEGERQQTQARADTAGSQHGDQAAQTARELEALRQQMQQKDALLAELRQQLEEVTDQPIDNVDTYEAELNQFRRQLESDRQRLNDEIGSLRQRNKELDESTRDMEMTLSRERADLARERQRLDRMREDFRQELERLQRDSGITDRLAPLQRLRDEMTDRKTPPPPGSKSDSGLMNRLQTLRARLNSNGT